MPDSAKSSRQAGPSGPRKPPATCATRTREKRTRATPETCDQKGCNAAGAFRAPKGRDRLDEFYWFCLDHIREYNLGWDFFAGLSAEEIEAIRWNDTIWERPTWPLGSAETAGPHAGEARLREALNRFRAAAEAGRPAPGPPPPGDAQRRALDVFGLDLPVALDRVKARYKELVKRHHPDANGGDRLAEERLKEINGAYQTLTNFVLS